VRSPDRHVQIRTLRLGPLTGELCAFQPNVPASLLWAEGVVPGSYPGSIVRVKISVSLPAEDVKLLDEHARRAGLPSRSAALHQAVLLLRLVELEVDYVSAWDEWVSSGDQASWENVTADGLPGAAG
jgi:Arc/MetJ-type ribon-helix-helix transcriptional regulator